MATEAQDLYGFPIKVTELQKAERRACDEASDLQVPAWMEHIQQDKLPAEARLKELIRKGVPPTCRTWVWMNTSTAARKKAAVASNYYQIMVSAGEKSPFLAEIEQDLPATFPSHPWMQSEDGRAALKRVLAAYSVHNDRLGYCRAMNNVVGLLLVAMNRNEENAFWLLSSLVDDILYPGTYSRNLQGCQVEMRALDELLSHKLPQLHAHFARTECDISLIATDWYLCLYSTSLPAETVCRVWDGLFNEGPKILFRVALALLKLHEEQLLQCTNAGDIVMTMRQAAANMHHSDKLMATAFEGIGSLSMATLDKYRDAKAREVESGSAGGVPDGNLSKSGALKNEKLEVAADKMKEGAGKFMKAFNKWADKTANQMANSMAKAVEKIGIKDDEPAAARK